MTRFYTSKMARLLLEFAFGF